MFQGYNGIMHGGVISCLLDGAMTNCLFSTGITATTGELRLRFLHPVVTDRLATVKAWVIKTHPPLHIVEAELRQGNKLLVRATGKFMEPSSEVPAESGCYESTGGPVHGGTADAGLRLIRCGSQSEVQDHHRR
jgi:hypothetical protein